MASYVTLQDNTKKRKQGSLVMGNSLVVQWLGLGPFISGAQVQSLVEELRSCKPNGVAKKKKEK